MINVVYNRLFKAFGYQYWWPAETQEEMIIGAILTQNTNWTNVEIAIDLLKRNGICSFKKIKESDSDLVKDCIKSSGYFNLKYKKLIHVIEALESKDLYSLSLEQAREYLLSIWGIGPETADSILLYGFEFPIFVIDTYTLRLFSRLDKDFEETKYYILQKYIMQNSQNSVSVFQEFHALIVKNAKIACKKKPICLNCTLKDICAYYKELKCEC